MATKWGVISAADICHDFVTAVQSIPENCHEFLAVAARDLSSAQEFAKNHNIPIAYGSYEDLAKDPNIEIVYIGTVTKYHFSVAKLILENGKHVLCEKPMTINAKQTKILIHVAKQQKRFLMEALWSRFVPAYKKLMELVKNGSIGDIIHVNINFGVSMLRPLKKDLAQSIYLYVGVYALNAISMIYEDKKPTKIAAVGHLNDDGIDVAMTSSLLYTKNRTASVTTNALAQFPCDLVITGTKGSIKVPNPFWCPTIIEVGEKTYKFPLPDTIRPCCYKNSSALRYQAMEVRECLKDGKLESSIMPLTDSETLAEMSDEIRHQIGFYFLED